MAQHLYAIRVETNRLVAAEIDPATAAQLLDRACPLLLGTAEHLARVAQRLGRPLVMIARGASGRSASTQPPPEPRKRFASRREVHDSEHGIARVA
ncbi:MAG: hypothetical protein KJ000_10780 [Pirellulaceae bacterium]|nr:hypothetical protein [Pirellulaceae bacterium]